MRGPVYELFEQATYKPKRIFSYYRIEKIKFGDVLWFSEKYDTHIHDSFYYYYAKTSATNRHWYSKTDIFFVILLTSK